MGRLCVVLLIAASGCSRVFGLDAPKLVDADTSVDIDAPLADAHVDTPPGEACFGSASGLLVVCFAAGQEPTSPFSISSQTIINTDQATACTRVISQASPNPGLCLLTGTNISISSTLRATGSRPLVLLATDTLTLSGTIDVSAVGSAPGAGGNSTSCPTTLAGSNVSGAKGAGGGGGGGFGGSGGGGGSADAPGGGSGTSVALVAIRGGCPGGVGGMSIAAAPAIAGAGGGAVYVIAGNAINLNGVINASGAGGKGGGPQAGGAGGGSGGLVGFDAPSITINGGTVIANGGGGGEGGSNANPGTDGASPDPGAPTQRAQGGTGGSAAGGNGGDGSAGTILTGGVGGTGANGAGGGGGGGGAGRVKVFGASATFGNQVSPPAT